MPSTLELIRFQNSLSKMSSFTRTQFITETLTWLEQEEHGKLRPSEESEFVSFVKDLQAAKTAPVDGSWYQQIFIKNKNNGYFLRFLQRIR